MSVFDNASHVLQVVSVNYETEIPQYHIPFCCHLLLLLLIYYCRNVEVLIYVFDVDSGDFENDITLFDGKLMRYKYHMC